MDPGKTNRTLVLSLALAALSAVPVSADEAGQFSSSNIGSLVPRFSVVLGGAVEGAGHYRNVATHNYLAKGSSIFTIDGWGGISKLDLTRKGERVWYNDLGRRNIDAWLQASRGMALDGDIIFAAGSDGLLHWLDAGSGDLIRSVSAGDPREGFDVVAAPLVTDRLVLIAASADDRVGPFAILAFDKATGERVWEAQLDELSGLSASVRQQGVFDAERGQVIWPFSAPAIAVPEPERDLWAGSGIVAVDVKTGALRWVHRESAPAVPLPSDGPVHLMPASAGHLAQLLQFRGDGTVARLDPATGALLGRPAIYGVEPGRIVYASGEHAELSVIPPTATCENSWAVNGYVSTVDVATGIAYGSNANACIGGVGHIRMNDHEPNWLGAYYAGHDASLGLLTATDAATGKVLAQRIFPAPLVGGASIAGENLVAVTSADGMLYLLDGTTLETATERHLAALASVQPLVVNVEGKDNLIVAVGGNAVSPYLAYRSPDLDMSEGLLVLVALGLRDQ